MASQGTSREQALSAMLICPDRALAAEVLKSFLDARVFEVLSELRSYPEAQTLEIRLRQIQPEVVFIDLSSEPESALELIRALVAAHPLVQVIGLHHRNEASILLPSLRAGACDFLYSPFETGTQREAAARLKRLNHAEHRGGQEFGRVAIFTSAKPGAGASTLAMQTAFALRRITGQRVLLADLDVMAGAIGFTLKLNASYSLLDALEQSDTLDPAAWAALTASAGGVDVLAAPEAATSDVVEPSRLHEVVEYSRLLYDWVVIDLPAVFHRLSLFLLSEADQSFLVSTPDLPSLHLGRRAVGLLTQLGFERDRYQMLVNRFGKRDNIAVPDMEQIFGCRVKMTFPNDYYGLHRAITRAESVPPDTELGRAIEKLSSWIVGVAGQPQRQKPALIDG